MIVIWTAIWCFPLKSLKPTSSGTQACKQMMGSSSQTTAVLGVCLCMFTHAPHILSCWHAFVLVCDCHIICNSNCQHLWNCSCELCTQSCAHVYCPFSKSEWWTMEGSESSEPVWSELSFSCLRSLTCDPITFPHIDLPSPPTITGLHPPPTTTSLIPKVTLALPVLLASIYLLAKQHCNWLSNNKQ